MSVVHINLEDMGDGTMAMGVDYVGGFNVKSHAHQHAYLLIQKMNELAKPLEEPTVTVSPLEEVAHGFNALATWRPSLV